MKEVIKNSVSALAFLALCALIGLLFGCPIKRAIGLPCPGCGMTRGCLALMRGNLGAALRWHPLCILVPIAFSVYVFKDAAPVKRLFIRRSLMLILFALCIGVYAVRMALYFPHFPPMDFEENSLIGKIVLILLLH